MNSETLTALKVAEAHWERLASGTRGENEAIGSPDCALCELFIDDGCIGCPVMKRTGMRMCGETPYGKAYTAMNAFGYDSHEFKAAASKELEFLRSLLPKKEKK